MTLGNNPWTKLKRTSALALFLVFSWLIGFAPAASAQAVDGPSGPLLDLTTNKCLDVAGGLLQSGRYVQEWRCNGTAAQQWQYRPATHQIVLAQNSSLCLTGTDPTYDNTGTFVVTCNTADRNQGWVRRADGTFANDATGRCLQHQLGHQLRDDSNENGDVAITYYLCGPDATWSLPAVQLAGTAVLRAHSNGKYVGADFTTNTQLSATGATSNASNQFALSYNSDGTYSLKALANGEYVTADPNDTKLYANRTVASTWEKFNLTYNSDGSVSLKALANGEYVTADPNDTKLYANRAVASTWEQFDLIYN